MRVAACGIFLCWFLGVVSWAQELPVEIQLVPPRDYVPLEAPLSSSHSPFWIAPPVVCSLCSELRKNGRCGCDRLLTQELADQLFGDLRILVFRLFRDGFALDRAVSVRVVSNASLRERGGPGGRLFGLYEDDVIYLDQNMDRRKAFSVLAHEYGHAWQYQENLDIERVDDLRFEGFAEWFSYRVVSEIGDLERVAEIERDPSVYGRGARCYLALEAKEGLDGVIGRAKSPSAGH